MLMKAEVIVCLGLSYRWITLCAITKLWFTYLDIGDRFKPVADVDSYMLRQAYEQACA